MYPYRRRVEQTEDPPPKERAACAILEHGDINERQIALVAISDCVSAESVELLPEEIAATSLSGLRKAYVHVEHYSLDRKANSYTYIPRQKPKGRLPRALTTRVAARLVENIRTGRAVRITRE